MDSLHSTTNQHVKRKHLSFEERVIIQLHLKDGCSLRAIPRELNCSPSTINYEIKHGTMKKSKDIRSLKDMIYIKLIVKIVSANHTFLRKLSSFAMFTNISLKTAGRLMFAVIVPLLLANSLAAMLSVCAKTLYNYVDQGLLSIYNYDLLEKLKRNTKLHRVRKNKKKLGRSIEERPKEISERNKFGHWECDLVLEHKTKDDEVLLTLSERINREFLIIRIPDKTSVSVMQTFKELQRQYSEHWDDIFKTITTDNGSGFADLSNLEAVSKTLVYYAHPYTSCDKGTVERHNGLIHKFIPKGEAIANYSLQDIINIET